MFGRAHSGNLNALRRAIDAWTFDTLYIPEVNAWYDPAHRKHRVTCKIRHVRNVKDVLIERDLSDVPMIQDEDVLVTEVATWLNKQFRDYTGRYPNEVL